MVEEIVAWVNGNIITMSDLNEEEKLVTADAYRRLSGKELDKYVEQVRNELLLRLIDNRILVDRAKMLYDMPRMREALYTDFRANQKIKDDAELEQMLAHEGLTLEELKDRLVDLYAPERVLEFEVGGRVAVGDREVDEYYTSHLSEFLVPGEVTVREIVLMADTPDKKAARRDEAAQVRERAAATDDFAAVAQETSQAGTRGGGGLLGPLKRGELAPQLEQLAFTLPVGGVSEVLEMPYGFHILKVESRTEDRFTPLDEVRETLRTALENKKFAEQREEYLKKARANAEWCVKPSYRNRLMIPSPECPSL